MPKKHPTKADVGPAGAVTASADKRYSLAPQLPGSEDDSYALESNILNIEGFLFDLRRKHANKPGTNNFEEVYTDQDGNELNIVWHPKYGRPTVTAYKVLQALFVKSTSEKYPFENAVAFHQNDILRLTGIASSGQNHNNLYDALKQLQNTTITYEFFNKDLDKRVVADVKIIGSMFTVRDDKNKARIEKALIYWDPLIVDSMNADYWAAFNWSRIKKLDAVQSILFKRLFHHFSKIAGAKISALSDSSRADLAKVKSCLNNPMQKDLLDIFNFWLGGLKLPQHKSKIIEKYGDRLNGLKKTGVIKSWKVEKRKHGAGFKLVATPGSAFYEDYLGFYHSKLQPQLKFDKAKDDAEIKDPIELLVEFHTTRSGTNKAETDNFTAKEVEVASNLISHHQLAGAREFITYALNRARESKFKVRFLMGIMQYEQDWQAARKSNKVAAAKRAADDEQRVEEELELAYRRFSNAECDDWFANQSDKTQEALTRIAERNAGPDILPVALKHMRRIELRKGIRQMISLPSYEQWKKHRC